LTEEKVKAEKDAVQKKKDDEKRAKQVKEDEEVEAKLQAILNEPSSSGGNKAAKKRRSSQVKEDRERKRWNAVKDAWEIVRDGSSVTIPDDEIEADPRDLTAGDAGGLAEKGTRQGAQVLEVSREWLLLTTDHSLNSSTTITESTRGHHPHQSR
jgi:citrate synthase